MDRKLLLGTALQAGAMLSLPFLANAQPAPNARPTGGIVVAGAATISRTPSTTAISQSTQRAAINWQSFDIGQQQAVQFQQPSAASMALNRVVGPNPSQIAGRIDANGQVVITNQAGVVFYKGSQVNTAGLMVSAAGISNRNFMAGHMVFDRPAAPNARVENRGTITVRQAGLAALVAPQVANSGVINARLGHVVLAGAQAATLDLYGDGLVSIDVTKQVQQAPAGAALVTNTGVIHADGGTVQLTAEAADGVVQTLVNAGGRIRAASVGDRTGTITLNGIGGSINVAGQLAAPGSAPGTTGGAVEVVSTGDATIASTARINVSGRAGGGVVAIGTTLERARSGPTATARRLSANATIAQGATIKADAIQNGNGGQIAILSAGHTRIGGAISAKGGTQGGNGGFVETSGNSLGVTGSVDLGAPHGSLGTWLLDPEFLDVVSGPPPVGTEDGAFTENGGTVLAGDERTGTPDTISNGIINTTTADVLLQANQTLTVGGDINLTLMPYQRLTLEAGGTIAVKAGVSVTASGDVTMATGGAGPEGAAPPLPRPSPLITIAGTVSSTNGGVTLESGTGGAISITGGGAVTAYSVVLSGGTGGVALTGNARLGTPTTYLDISSAAPVTEANTATVSAAYLTSSSGISGGMTLPSSGNAIAAINQVVVHNGDLTVVTGTDLQLTGAINANNLFLAVARTGGTMTIGSPPVEGEGMPATLAAADKGRISLVADAYAVPSAATVSNAAQSSIAVNGGTLELAPFSAVNASLGGNSGFAASPALLGLISTPIATLDVGGYTNVPAGATAPAASASSVSVDAWFTPGSQIATLRLDATGAITQPGGPIIVGTLTGTGGDWTLNDPNNTIGTLANVTANSFTLADNAALTVAGTVKATAAVTLTDAGSMNIPGAITAGSIALAAGTGASYSSDSEIVLSPSGSITATGVLTAGTLTATAPDAISLSGGNHIATLGNVSGQDVSVNDTTDLSVAGIVVSLGTVSLATSGSLDIPGAVRASLVTLSGTKAISGKGIVTASTLTAGSSGPVDLTGANSISALGNTTASSLTLNDTTSITIDGTVTVTNAASITDTGSISVPGAVNAGMLSLGAGKGIDATGILTAGTLTATAPDAISLSGGNHIGALGNSSADSLTLNDLTDLSVSGAVKVTKTASLTDSGSITVPGGIAASMIALSAGTGAISATGDLSAATLTASATGPISLTGTNAVTSLGNVTGQSFTLNDASDVVIGGTLTATRMLIQAAGRQITLGDGAVLVTSGTARPAGAIQTALEPANGAPGAYFSSASFTQSGSSKVVGADGGATTLQIATTGNTQFDATRGLQAPGTWLILDVPTGTAAGTVAVNALDLAYVTPGGANLSGTIGGISGGPAAAAANIQPATDAHYLFNQCVIGLATCTFPIVVPPVTVPPVEVPPVVVPPVEVPPVTVPPVVPIATPPVVVPPVEVPPVTVPPVVPVATPPVTVPLVPVSPYVPVTIPAPAPIIVPTAPELPLVPNVPVETPLPPVTPSLPIATVPTPAVPQPEPIAPAPAAPPVVALVPTPPLETPPAPPAPAPLAPLVIAGAPAPQSVLGGISYFLTGTRPPPLPTLPHLDVIVLPTPAPAARQLTPEDVVPPNISPEDY